MNDQPEHERIDTTQTEAAQPPPTAPTLDDDLRTAPIPNFDSRTLSKPTLDDDTADDLRTAPIPDFDSRTLSKPTLDDDTGELVAYYQRKIADGAPDASDDALRTMPAPAFDSRLLSKPEGDAGHTQPPSALDADALSHPVMIAPRVLKAPSAADSDLITAPDLMPLAVTAPLPSEPPSAAPPSRQPPWLRRLRRQLTTQFNPTSNVNWLHVVYAPDIDELLADIALEDSDPAVAEQAARTIGRIRSQAAVMAIAARQRAGKPGALRALAIIRDEVATLPAGVSRQARLYAWFTNTARRLGEMPLRSVWRFLLALAGAAVAFGLYTWGNLPGFSIFEPDRWSAGVSVGLTMGILLGFRALLAGEFPARLRGFFPWWGVLGMALVGGTALVAFTWSAFTWLFLKYPVVEWTPIILAGIGGALGIGAASLVRLPGVVSALVDGMSMWIPLYLAWQMNWNTGTAAVIYFREFNGVYTELIPMIALIAAGAWAQALWRDVRWVLGGVRRLWRGRMQAKRA